VRTSQSTRITGWFWLPEADQVRVPGILTWDQADGANLELIGGLNAPGSEGAKPERPRKPDQFDGAATILGQSTDARAITIWQAQLGNHRSRQDGQWIEQFWNASWVIVGDHLPDAASTHFSAVTADIDNLYYLTMDGRLCPPQWTSIPGVEDPAKQQPDGTVLYPWALGVVGGHRASVSSASLSGLTYRIATDATRPWISPATEAYPALKLDLMTRRTRRGCSVKVLVTSSAHIEPKDGGQIVGGSLLETLSPLLSLVRLATFERPGLAGLSAVTDDERQVQILCRSGHPAAPEESPGDSSSPVFTLTDVSLSSYFDFWSKSTASPQARYALNVALGIIGHRSRFVEEGLSQTLAAAEGFHAWCLGEGGRSGLDKRLKALHNALPEQVQTYLGLPIDQWADWGRWARNHVDHAGVDEHRDLTPMQMQRLSDAVGLVLYLRILMGIGVSEANMLEALRTNRRLEMLREKAAALDLPLNAPSDKP
jgi:hypothetical protein